MCGIAGIFDFENRPISPSKIVRMAAAQAHRGPDGEGAVFFSADGKLERFETLSPLSVAIRGEGAVGALAHRRLAIIDLSERAAQPMADERGFCWITYNGEIYNYIELRDELKAKGRVFRTTSDTEVILQAYLEWGFDCLAHLNGMFAFALWDTQSRRLFCARDRLGIKPFYYRYRDHRLLFASEPKAILEALDRRPAPNVAAMADYLALSYVPSEETMFEGIHRLPPGNSLLADANGIEVTSYWDPAFARDNGRGAEERVEELRALLRDSIRLQIRSDVPIGAHLSGGMDSSLVCSLAAQQVPKLLTFSARFSEGEAFDESRYARLVAQRIGSEHHEISPAGERLNELLPKIIYHLDEPVEAPAIFGKYHVAKTVGAHVKVALTGHGGDELFGGYDWYIKNLFTAASFGGGCELGEHARARFLWRALKEAEYPRRLAKSLWKNLGCSDLSTIFYRNWDRVGLDGPMEVFRREVLNGHAHTAERFRASYAKLPEACDGDRMFKFDMRYYLEALLTSEDRLSMAFSVESRVPLLDHRIAEFAGRLGFELKTEPGRSKLLLRLAADGIVAPEILARRDKRGFPTPVAAWLKDPKLRLFDSLVFSGNSFAQTYFDLPYIKRLLRARLHFGSDWSERLWRVLNLSVWGRVFGLS